jgi:hypothetical protein
MTAMEFSESAQWFIGFAAFMLGTGLIAGACTAAVLRFRRDTPKDEV